MSTAFQTQRGLGIFGQKMAPSDSLVQRFLWKNRKNGIFEVLFQYVNDIVQMRDMAHSICLIKLYQITMRKNFDFLFLTTTLSKKRQSRRWGAQQGNSHSNAIEDSWILIVWHCFFLTASCCLSYLSYWESKKLSLNFKEMTSILQRKLNLHKAYESKIHYSQRQNPWSDAKITPNPLSTHHLKSTIQWAGS